MKFKTLTFAIAALAIPSLAFAEDGEEKGKKGKHCKEHREAILEKFDADGDGKLSEEERETAKAAMKAKRKELLEKYDVDGDGKLNAEERQAAKDAGERIPCKKHKGKKGKKGPKPSAS